MINTVSKLALVVLAKSSKEELEAAEQAAILVAKFGDEDERRALLKDKKKLAQILKKEENSSSKNTVLHILAHTLELSLLDDFLNVPGIETLKSTRSSGSVLKTLIQHSPNADAVALKILKKFPKLLPGDYEAIIHRSKNTVVLRELMRRLNSVFDIELARAFIHAQGKPKEYYDQLYNIIKKHGKIPLSLLIPLANSCGEEIQLEILKSPDVDKKETKYSDKTAIEELAKHGSEKVQLAILKYPGVTKKNRSNNTSLLHILAEHGKDTVLEKIINMTKDMDILDLIHESAEDENIKKKALNKINDMQGLKITNVDPELEDIEKALKKVSESSLRKINLGLSNE